MKQAGHAGMALAWAAPLSVLLSVTNGFLVAAGATLIALSVASLPDSMDFSTELLSHRGGTHTVWFGLLVAGLVGFITLAGLAVTTKSAASITSGGIGAAVLVVLPSPVAGGAIAGVSAFLGIASHLFADALTVGRGSNLIRPLWPLSSRELYYGFTKYDDSWWNYGLFVIGVLCQIGVFIVLFQFGQPLLTVAGIVSGPALI